MLCQKIYELQKKLDKSVENIEGIYQGIGYEYNEKNENIFTLNYNIEVNIKKIKDNIYFIATTYTNEDPNYNYFSTKYGILKENMILLNTEFAFHQLEFNSKKELYFCYSVNKHPEFGNLVGNYHFRHL